MEIYDSIHLPELESSKTKIIRECLAHSRLLVKIRGSFGWLEIVLKTEWSGHGAPSIWEDEAEEWQGHETSLGYTARPVSKETKRLSG